MAASADSSSIPPQNDKPVIVRVKRKASQSLLDAFWLEINERPLKRPLLDFGKLSISDSPSTRVEELKTKILVRHVETVSSSEDTLDVLQSFMTNSSDASLSKEKSKDRRHNLKTAIMQDQLLVKAKQDQLLVKAKQKQEAVSKNARYEQVWRSRKGKKEALEEEAVYETCRLYDVVRVDEQETEVKKESDTDLEECSMMAQYLPLLREVMPTAAVEIENDIQASISRQASLEDYVYDVYAVNDDDIVMEDSVDQYPLVQVDDDDYYDGPDDSEYESDDSNAENNPLNDYPDEEISDDEDEVTSRSSDEKSEVESTTSENQSDSTETGSEIAYDCEGSLSDVADQFFQDEGFSEGDSDYSFDD